MARSVVSSPIHRRFSSCAAAMVGAEASGIVPFGADAVATRSRPDVANYPYCLNLIARRAMGRDLHHVRLVLVSQASAPIASASERASQTATSCVLEFT
jgi:hypothetical protein